jgi:three-Cys-motif partner protein
VTKSDDRWNELCALVKDDDGFPARPAGVWTRDKLRFWDTYISITTPSMAAKWSALVYVDLFASTGVCTLPSGQRIPGSTLIAALAPTPFTKIIACERAPEKADALRGRLQRLSRTKDWNVLTGDCNYLVSEIADQIPPGALTLAFVDPTGLHVHFDTIKTLTQNRSVDLLVLFADRIDIHRNFQTYASQESSRLDLFFGPSGQKVWRERLHALNSWTTETVCNTMADLYKELLGNELGYVPNAEKWMSNSTTYIYRLIYASRHSLGLKFWNEAIKKDPGGQRSLFG